MNEASVSSAFMTALRKRLPEAVVIKHRDASFIGLPDCSVTFRGRVFWIEFKLWVPGKRWDGQTCNVQAIAEKSPAQFDMMRRLYKSAIAQVFYIVWAKKSGRCFVWTPNSEGGECANGVEISQASLVAWTAQYIEGLTL